jgi:hypothetical protein
VWFSGNVHGEFKYLCGKAPACRDQIWGGLALGILLPHKRSGRFEVTARSERTLQLILEYQKLILEYQKQTFLQRAVNKIKRLWWSMLAR